MKFNSRTDSLAAMVAAQSDDEVMIFTNKDRAEILKVSQIPLVGRSNLGESVIALSRDEKIVSVINAKLGKLSV